MVGGAKRLQGLKDFAAKSLPAQEAVPLLHRLDRPLEQALPAARTLTQRYESAQGPSAVPREQPDLVETADLPYLDTAQFVEDVRAGRHRAGPGQQAAKAKLDRSGLFGRAPRKPLTEADTAAAPTAPAPQDAPLSQPRPSAFLDDQAYDIAQAETGVQTDATPPALGAAETENNKQSSDAAVIGAREQERLDEEARRQREREAAATYTDQVLVAFRQDEDAYTAAVAAEVAALADDVEGAQRYEDTFYEPNWRGHADGSKRLAERAFVKLESGYHSPPEGFDAWLAANGDRYPRLSEDPFVAFVQVADPSVDDGALLEFAAHRAERAVLARADADRRWAKAAAQAQGVADVAIGAIQGAGAMADGAAAIALAQTDLTASAGRVICAKN